MNGWHIISLMVILCLGSSTKIFFMKSLASYGTLVFFLIDNKYWKIILAIFNFFVRHLYLIGLKRWSAKQARKADDSCWPDVHFVRMAYWSLHNLWRDVIWSTAHGTFLLVCELKFGRKPKITHLDFHRIIQKNIAQLKISMDNSIWVHVVDRRDELVHKVPRLFGCKLFTFFYHLTHRLDIANTVPCSCRVTKWYTQILSPQRHYRTPRCTDDARFYVFWFMRGAERLRWKGTFCLALFFWRVFLSMTLTACRVLV